MYFTSKIYIACTINTIILLDPGAGQSYVPRHQSPGLKIFCNPIKIKDKAEIVKSISAGVHNFL